MRIVRARVKKAGTNAWQKILCIKLTRLGNITVLTGFRIKHGMPHIRMVLTLIPFAAPSVRASRR